MQPGKKQHIICAGRHQRAIRLQDTRPMCRVRYYMKRLLTILIVAVVAAGCTPSHSVAVAPIREMTLEEANFESLFLASETVLRDHGFEIDRRDRRRGEVTTKPMLARQPLEFWRDDTDEFYQMAENAMHKTFLIAQVEIARLHPESIEFGATVKVIRVRSSSREQAFEPTIYGRGDLSRIGTEAPTAYDGNPNFAKMGEDEDLATKMEAEISLDAIHQHARLARHPDVGH